MLFVIPDKEPILISDASPLKSWSTASMINCYCLAPFAHMLCNFLMQFSVFCMLLHLAGAFYLQEDSMAAASLMSGMADLVKGHPVVVSYFIP